MINTILPSFNSGELSPRLWSRVDLDKYGSGCRVLENFITMPYGGINRRPGTAYIAPAKNANTKARLVSFNFSTTTNFILEFGPQYIRFFTAGAQLLSGGSPYEIPTPYAEAALFELQFVQINDVMYIAHANYPVYKLSRFGNTNWTLAQVQWSYPPFQDENLTATTITPSATGGNITLTASAPVFASGDVGGYYRIGHRRSSSSITLALTANGTSASMRVIGQWEFVTTGIWQGTILIEASYNDGATWETVRSFDGAKDRNIITTGNQSEDCLLRVRMTNYAASTAPTFAYLDAVEAAVYGVVRITGVTSSTSASATVIKTLVSTAATARWAEGAWSTRRGFPRTVVFHQQRLFFGGNAAQAVNVWGSTLGDFENFALSTLDDAALSITLATVEQNAINWMVSHRKQLIIGTSGDEFVLQPAGNGATLTPSSLDAQRQSRYGSSYLQAALVNNAVLYTQRHSRKIMELFYNYQIDGFVSQDLTLLSEHVTQGGIVQHAFQQSLDPTLWAITSGGTLAGMTYDRNQNVVSWHRHLTDGSFESVAAIYGATSGGDELWVLVKRTVNGQTVRYIERFDPEYRDTLDNADSSKWFYVDCGKSFYNATPATTFTGLNHLEGKTVSVLADGAVHPDVVVSGGAITLQQGARRVAVGLPYLSTLTPTSLDIGATQQGTTQGRHFRVHRLGVRFFKSLGGQYETAPGVFDPILYRDFEVPMGQGPGPFTGQKDLMVAGSFAKTADVTLRQHQPLPMTILALIPRLDVYGD